MHQIVKNYLILFALPLLLGAAGILLADLLIRIAAKRRKDGEGE